MEFSALLISLCLLLFFAYKFLKYRRLVLFLPIFYSFIVLYTVVGTYVYSFAVEAPFNLYYEISNEDITKTYYVFIIASVSFYIGSSLCKYKKQVFINGRSLEINNQKTLIISILGVYLVYVIGYGLEPLIYRSGYIDKQTERNLVVLILFNVISPIVTTLIPFIRSKWLKYMVYIFCLLIIFSSSSRMVIIVPFLYMIGTFLKGKNIGIGVFIFNFSLIIFLFIFILQIRYYSHHGLIPNFNSLFTKGIDVTYLYLGINYIFSFSIFASAFVLKSFAHDHTAFFISLNPLPSSFLDIEYMLDAHRMKPTAPMPAIAILSLYGYGALCSFYFFTGFMFSLMLKKMQNKSFLYYVVVGLFLFFSLLSVQYNLRGLVRLFYYSICIYIFYNVFKKVRIKITPK